MKWHVEENALKQFFFFFYILIPQILIAINILFNFARLKF